MYGQITVILKMFYILQNLLLISLDPQYNALEASGECAGRLICLPSFQPTLLRAELFLNKNGC